MSSRPFKVSLSLCLWTFDKKMKMLVVFGILLHGSQHALAEKVEVYEGAESVLLPCLYHGHIPDLPDVLWTCNDLNPNLVHLHREDKEILRDQNQVYRGRTSMRPDALDSGDFSLTLRKPELSDSRSYTCSIGDKSEHLRVADVQLKVKDDPKQVTVNEGAESVILPCTTTPDLPEGTRVEWTCSEPNVIKVYSNTIKHDMNQDNPYCGRTRMNEDLLRSGDLSLTLRYPTERDSGSYICTVYRDKDVLRHKVVLTYVKERFPSWAIVVLVLLVLVLIVSAGVLFHFRHNFKSVFQVEVESGAESVLLLCRTTVHLPEDAKVVWRDSRDRKVLVFENGSDQPEDQDQFYKNRTEIFKNLLRTGDLSLVLKRPTDEDSRTFTCSCSWKGNVLVMKQIELKVKVPQVEMESEEVCVLLPCKFLVQVAEDAKVEWSDKLDRLVYVFENGSDQPKEQHQIYRNRTGINQSLFATGDLSLKLEYPTDQDSGTFTCRVFSREGKVLMMKQVVLKVKDHQVEVEEGAESVLLPFRTAPALPEDSSVKWWDADLRTVHLYENCFDQPAEQNQYYRKRTRMNEDLLTTGDLSLTLDHPTERDSGEYRCIVRSRRMFLRGKSFNLKVVVRHQPPFSGRSVQVPDPPEDIRTRTPLMADEPV